MASHAAADTLGFTTRQIHPTFGLEISGLDVSKPLDGRTVEALRQLSGEYKLLIFKNQNLSPHLLNGFAAHFGDTDQPSPNVPGSGGGVRTDNVLQLGNVEASDAVIVEPSGYGLAARIWHADSSWRPVPTWLTFLSAAELPDADGDTAFCDEQAAYDALSDERKALLEGKQMVHSWRNLRHHVPSVPPMGDDENVPPPVTHPVVRTVGGRKGLFLNGHTAWYVGNMPLDEGKALFEELMTHATRPEFTYQHKWSIGDLAVWDNRTTMHKAMPYDTRQRRVMHRAEVIGTEAP